MPLHLVVLCAAVLATVPGCSGDAGARPGPDATVAQDSSARLQTDSVVYRLTPEREGLATRIGYSYYNPGADTVYIVNCNGAVTMNLEKWEGNRWIDFWTGAMNGCLSPPITIAPGGSFVGVQQIWGAPPGTTSATAFAGADFEGRFRLMWHHLRLNYSADALNFGDTLSLEHRRSNEFSLTKAAPR